MVTTTTTTTNRQAAAMHWPLFDLTVRSGEVELRYVNDELAVALADLAAEGIHDPAVMPFSIAWTDVGPPRLQRDSLQFFWRCRAELCAASWVLPFAVLSGGRVVGSCSLRADHFATLRAVETGSWLGLAYQGRGLGTALRRAVLHLAFAGLGAQVALSAAMVDNVASQAVSRRLGYRDNGLQLCAVRDEARWQQRFLLERAAWERSAAAGIELAGVEPCLPLLVG